MSDVIIPRGYTEEKIVAAAQIHAYTMVSAKWNKNTEWAAVGKEHAEAQSVYNMLKIRDNNAPHERTEESTQRLYDAKVRYEAIEPRYTELNNEYQSELQTKRAELVRSEILAYREGKANRSGCAEIEELREAIEELQGRVEELESKIEEVESAAEEAQNTAEEAQSKADEFESRIDELENNS